VDILFVILAFAAATGFSWWSYSGQKVQPPLKTVLIVLRSLALGLVLALLIDPGFSWMTEQESRKKIILALDNSYSAGFKKGTYRGADEAKAAATRITDALDAKTALKTVLFDTDVRTGSQDSLTFEGGQTNTSMLLESIRQETDLAALVVLTDGISTVGKDPQYLIKDLGIPVFAIALGDTGKVNDIWIDEVESPETAYTGTASPITAYIGHHGFEGTSLSVQLKSGDKTLARKTIQPSSGATRIPVRFQVEPREKGLQSYTVVLDNHPDEFSPANNQRTFSVDVKNGRTRIVYLVFDLNPDVKSVREILESDPSVKIHPVFMNSVGRWYGKNRLPVSPDSAELIVVHGIPNAQQLAAFNPFESNWKSRPFVLLASNGSRFEAVQQNEWFPLRFQGFPDWRPIQLMVMPQAANHPVLNGLQGDVSKFPPLAGTLRKSEVKPGGVVLFTSGFLGADAEAPAVILRQRGLQRSVLIAAHGFSAWWVNPDPASRAYAEKLISSLVLWAAADTDASRSIVRPLKPVFSPQDDIQFEADVRNESGEAEQNATVTVKLPDTRLGTFTFRREKAGVYTINAGRLQPGKYKYEAVIAIPGTADQPFTGSFEVVDQNLEASNLIRNQAFLEILAAETGGELVETGGIDKLLSDMETRGLMKASQTWTEQRYSLRTDWWWFALTISLLAAEWLLRKKASLS
jgi:hypothetical protein